MYLQLPGMRIGTAPGLSLLQSFEWDEGKRAANLAKHGIDFEDARAIWLGPVAPAAIESVG